MILLACIGPLLSVALLAAQDGQKEEEARRKIDVRIERFLKSGRKVGLGLLRECIVDTLAFGVPVWNAGKQEACTRFYAKTAESLCAACPGEERATTAGWKALGDLNAALKRAAAEDGFEGKAWALRYAFDKILLLWDAEGSRLKALIGLGNQAFARMQYAEAADAFREAVPITADVMGQELSSFDVSSRGAPLLLAHALILEGRFKEASQSILLGLRYIPEFPSSTFDLRTLFRADRYESMMDRLQKALEASPEDADLLFLRGYVLYYSGKRDDAKALFERALKASPAHAGARLYTGDAEDPKKGKNF